MRRQVSEQEYQSAIRRLGAVRDPAVHKPGGVGEVERWLTPEGKVCAYLVVRYCKGEHDYDYYVEE